MDEHLREPLRFYGFRLSREHSDMIDALARKQGRSRAGVIRRMVELAYQQTMKPEPEAATERNFRGRA